MKQRVLGREQKQRCKIVNTEIDFERETVLIAKEQKLKFQTIEVLHDIDRPEDIDLWYFCNAFITRKNIHKQKRGC
jgi:glycosyltransferase A (GT-A) superfamily protein (DUF2064 family)